MLWGGAHPAVAAWPPSASTTSTERLPGGACGANPTETRQFRTAHALSGSLGKKGSPREPLENGERQSRPNGKKAPHRSGERGRSGHS